MTRRLYPASPPLYGRFNDDAVREARATLGDETFDLLSIEGASIPLEQFRETLQREIDDLLASADWTR